MITAEDLKTALFNASLNISKHRDEVDNLNVFPVPDGDTGTNLTLTLEACVNEIKDISGIGAGALADKAACALLKGARGNSGVIFALIFKGFAQSVDGLDYIDSKALAKGLECGCDEAYAAIEKPTEGTILTVIRIAASKASDTAEKGNGCKNVFNAAISGAKNALKSTPNLLPILKKNSVVDAGGQGLVYILEGMLGIQKSDTQKSVPEKQTDEGKEIKFTYCTEFLIEKNEKCDVPKLRRFLSDIGDCSVAVENKNIVKVHVHTNSPDLAIGKGLEYGDLSAIKIDNMRIQSVAKSTKFVCEMIEICNGSGIRNYLEKFKGVHVLDCNDALNASTGDIAELINSCVSDDIFLLTNCKNNILAANQASRMSDKKVHVIPSHDIVQGIAAAKVFDPADTFENNIEKISNAVSNSVSGAVTYTAKHGEYGDNFFSPGQIIGISGKEIICVDKDICTSAVNVISHLTKDSRKNKVTVFYGRDTNISNAKKVSMLAHDKNKSIDVEIIEGGQPIYYYLISVE